MTDALTSQWVLHGAMTTSQGVLIVLAVLLAMALACRASWSARRAASATVVWGSFALRCGALLVLGVMLFQPALAWTLANREQGRILVAVDVSDSMQSADAHASARELLQWGVGLGWLDRATAAEPLQNNEVPRDAALAARFANLSRSEIAARLVTEPQSGLNTALAPLGDVELHVFAGETLAVTPTEFSTWAAASSAVPTNTTQTATVLREASTAAAKRTLGVVLLTDGRDASPADALAQAKQLGATGTPIYPVLIGSTERPRDIVVLAVDAPLTVYRGDHPRVTVTLSAHGFEASPVTVVLSETGRHEPLATQMVSATGRPQTLTFTIAPAELGRHRYRVSIAPRPEETRDDNNEREFTVQLVDDRAHVLLADREPRWEFRYLEMALARDEHIDLQAVLFTQPFLKRLDQPFFPQAWPESTDGSVANRFRERDLVIIGDLEAAQAPADIWSELEKYVSEDGGTLVLIAGHESARQVELNPILTKLLPITRPQPRHATLTDKALPAQQGWRWQLTGDGVSHTFLQFAADAEANRTVWAALPGATWAIDGEPKPGATVWAQAASSAMTDAEPALPLLVHQHYGLGQVVWLATDSTWRWRWRVGDQFHHRFWGQLARWAATTKLSAGNEFVQFGAVRSSYAVGEAVSVEARWSARFVQQHPQRTATVELVRGPELLERRTLTADEKRPLVASTVWDDLPPGDYRARLRIEGVMPAPEVVESTFTVAAPQGTETADVTAEPAFLESLAHASGGRLFHLDQLDELPKAFPGFAAMSSQPVERPLWDRWPLLAMLITLLSGEWLLRRRFGLP